MTSDWEESSQWGLSINLITNLENLSPDTRTTRNFEQFITERNEYFPTPTNSAFHEVFENMKTKQFCLAEDDDIDLTSEEIKNYKNKYDTDTTQSVIEKLKKNIVGMYTQKIENSIVIEERRRLFNTFCVNISNSINSINEITTVSNDKDNKLKELLNDRIDWYYKQLDIDTLIEQEYQLKSEFHFLKTTLAQLSSISTPGVCPVCIENQVMWFIDPCGHTICDDCKRKTERLPKCHLCRSRKNQLNRLFL
jgi:hypothetical protein